MKLLVTSLLSWDNQGFGLSLAIFILIIKNGIKINYLLLFGYKKWFKSKGFEKLVILIWNSFIWKLLKIYLSVKQVLKAKVKVNYKK